MKKNGAEYFDSIADYLDERWYSRSVGYYIIQRRVKNLICMGDIRQNHTILDAGCGTGTPLLFLSRFVRIIVGIDLSTESIRRAKTKSKKISYCKVHFLVADAECMPFRKNVFDIVVAIELLEHVLKQSKVLMEFKKVLNVNGRSAISVPNALCPWNYTLRKLLMKINPKVFLSPIDRAFFPSEIINLCKNAGFKRIKREFIGFLIPEIPVTFLGFLRLAERFLEKIQVTKIFSGWIIIIGGKE